MSSFTEAEEAVGGFDINECARKDADECVYTPRRVNIASPEFEDVPDLPTAFARASRGSATLSAQPEPG
jgi:hypothetical protein